MPYSLWLVYLLSATVSGLRWTGPQETVVATATANWTPAPTKAAHDLLKRQTGSYPINLCGWQGSDFQPAYCSADSSCAWFTDYSVVGCCATAGSCDAVYTSCIDGNHPPQSLSYPGVYTCKGDDVCYRNSYDSGFYQYGCGTTTGGQSVATSYPDINTQLSVRIVLTGGVLDNVAPATLITQDTPTSTDTDGSSIVNIPDAVTVTSTTISEPSTESATASAAASSTQALISTTPTTISISSSPITTSALVSTITSDTYTAPTTVGLTTIHGIVGGAGGATSSTSSSAAVQSSSQPSPSSSSTHSTSSEATLAEASATSSSTSSPLPTPNPVKGLSKTATIAIAVVASVLGIIILGLLIFFFIYRRRKRNSPTQSPGHDQPTPAHAQTRPRPFSGFFGKEASKPVAETYPNYYMEPGTQYPPPNPVRSAPSELGNGGSAYGHANAAYNNAGYGSGNTGQTTYALPPLQQQQQQSGGMGMGMGGERQYGGGGMAMGMGRGGEMSPSDSATLRSEGEGGRWETMSTPTMVERERQGAGVYELPTARAVGPGY